VKDYAMGCSCQGGVEIMSVYKIEDLPEDVETVVLIVNPELKFVPSRNFKSNYSQLTYKLRTIDSVIEILKDDLTKMINLKSGKYDLFKVSDKSIEEFIVEEKIAPSNEESQTSEAELQKAPAQPVLVQETIEEDSEPTSELDDYTVISGIGKATDNKLKEAGFRTFEDLIGAKDVEKLHLGIQDEWIDQAIEIIGQ
jgi:predicted flap endonuclease-1-like 5' DNA nuclease